MKDGRKASAKSESDDQECGRWCWAPAQNHEAYNMGKAQILKTGRRGCQAVGPL